MQNHKYHIWGYWGAAVYAVLMLMWYWNGVIESERFWLRLIGGAVFIAILLPIGDWLTTNPAAKIWVQRLGFLIACVIIPLCLIVALVTYYIHKT